MCACVPWCSADEEVLQAILRLLLLGLSPLWSLCVCMRACVCVCVDACFEALVSPFSRPNKIVPDFPCPDRRLVCNFNDDYWLRGRLPTDCDWKIVGVCDHAVWASDAGAAHHGDI